MDKLKNFLVKDEGFTHYEQQHLLDLAVDAGAELYEYRGCTRHPHEGNGFSLNWGYFGVISDKTLFCDSASVPFDMGCLDAPDEVELLTYQESSDYLWDLIKEPESGEVIMTRNDFRGTKWDVRNWSTDLRIMWKDFMIGLGYHFPVGRKRLETSRVAFYYIDENGALLYRSDHRKSIQGFNSCSFKTRVFTDILPNKTQELVNEPESSEPLYKFNVGDTVKIKEGVNIVEYGDDSKRYFGEVGTVRATFTNVNEFNVYAVEFLDGGSITIIEECLQEHNVHVIDEVRAQSYYVDCPKCGAVNDDNLDPRGRDLECPGCGSILEVPYDVNLEWCCG